MQNNHAAQAVRLAEAYEKYADELFRFCRSKVMDAQEAEDLVQDTFLRTWEYVQEGNTVVDLKTFLYRVAENVVIDRQRKKKSVSLNELQEQGFDPGQETVDTVQKAIDVEQVLLSAEKKQEYRLLVMRYIDGKRPVDIATETGLAPNTVAVRLHRAVQKLTKKILEKRRRISGSSSVVLSRHDEGGNS